MKTGKVWKQLCVEKRGFSLLLGDSIKEAFLLVGAGATWCMGGQGYWLGRGGFFVTVGLAWLWQAGLLVWETRYLRDRLLATAPHSGAYLHNPVLVIWSSDPTIVLLVRPIATPPLWVFLPRFSSHCRPRFSSNWRFSCQCPVSGRKLARPR